MSLQQALINKFDYTKAEADREIAEAREQLNKYATNGEILAAQDICEELWGLEPDYLMDLM